MSQPLPIGITPVTSTAKSNADVTIIAVNSDKLAEAKLQDPPKVFSKSMVMHYGFCIIGFCCSSLYGFDASLMSAMLSLPAFQKEFDISVDGIKAGYVTSLLQIGAVCAIPFIFVIPDRFGRKWGMFIGSCSVILGTILEGCSAIHRDLGLFLGGRFFVGFGSALAVASASSYVVEIAHPAYRGVLSGALNCTYDIGGILAAGSTRGCSNYSGNRSWLIPVWLQLLFAGIVFLGSLFVAESPRWNYTHGKVEKAKDFIVKYHGEGNPDNAFVHLQMNEFADSLDVEDMRWWDIRDLFRTKSDRWRTMNCLTFAVYSAWSSGGMGSYIGAFLESAGITNSTSQLNFNLGYVVYSTVFAYSGAACCNLVNRRTLTLVGMAGMLVCWIGTTVGTAMYAKIGNQASARAGIAFYFLFATAYGISLTPLCGLYPYEVLSYRQRARGAAMYSFVNSACALVNQFGTPVSLQRIGWKTYLVFTVWVFVQGVWAYFTIVETRGYTLEEMDIIYAAPNPVKRSLEKRELIVDSENKVLGIVGVEKNVDNDAE